MRLVWRSIRNIVLFSLVIYGLSFIPPVRDGVRIASIPILLLLRRTGEIIVDTGHVIVAIGSLNRENGELRAKINELSAVEVANNELKHENELLRNELKLSTTNSSLLAAQVISRSVSVNQDTLLINKGTQDGFTKGMAVIAQGYLVGRIDQADAHTSRILLLTSSASELPVVLENSRSVGVLHGGPGGLTIEEIPRDIVVGINEGVVTSNIGDVIQSGIPVGKVGSVVAGKSDVFQSARITSPIDTSRLEVVFGVKKSP